MTFVGATTGKFASETWKKKVRMAAPAETSGGAGHWPRPEVGERGGAEGGLAPSVLGGRGG